MDISQQQNFAHSLAQSRNDDSKKDFQDKTTEKTGRGMQTAGTTANVGGKGMQAAGKSMEFAGKGLDTAGKGISVAGSGMARSGQALSSTGIGAIAGVPLAAAGGAVNLAGKGISLTGKGMDAAGRATDNVGRISSNLGKNATTLGKSFKNASEMSRALKQVRRNSPKNPLKSAKLIAKSVSLGEYINPFLDWLFGIALSVALLKDILDLVGFGSLPAIGTIITILASVTIGLIMFITGFGSNSKMIKGLIKSGAKRYGTLVFGTIIEMIFGINFLPIDTTVVVIVFILTLQERRSASLSNNFRKESYA